MNEGVGGPDQCSYLLLASWLPAGVDLGVHQKLGTRSPAVITSRISWLMDTPQPISTQTLFRVWLLHAPGHFTREWVLRSSCFGKDRVIWSWNKAWSSAIWALSWPPACVSIYRALGSHNGDRIPLDLLLEIVPWNPTSGMRGLSVRPLFCLASSVVSPCASRCLPWVFWWPLSSWSSLPSPLLWSWLGTSADMSFFLTLWCFLLPHPPIGSQEICTVGQTPSIPDATKQPVVARLQLFQPHPTPGTLNHSGTSPLSLSVFLDTV